MSYKIKTQPASEPVTLTEAKLHLKVDGSAEDNLITYLISAARDLAERYMNRSIITQTWELYLDVLPDQIDIWHGPVASISSVKYYDSDNTLQTLSATLYTTDIVSEPARINRAYSATYPYTYDRTNAVIVEFIAGQSSAPSLIKAAILLIIGHLYTNREDVITGHSAVEIPMGSKALLDHYRVAPHE